MRTCAKCKRSLTLTNFSKARPPYRHYRCKDCVRKQYRKWYLINGRNRAIDYAEAIHEWQKNNPEKVKAHSMLRNAVYKGKIIKAERCGKCHIKKRLSAHHIDYKKPYDVIWLCSSCHKLEHNMKK